MVDSLLAMPKYARVIVDQSGSNAFDYEIPAALDGRVQVGSRVRVPVRTREVLATVTGLLDETDARGVRPIAEVVGSKPVLTPMLIRLAQWIADYYCCPLDAAMRSVLPQVIRKGDVGYKERLFAQLAREVGDDELAQLGKKAPKQAAIIEVLREAGRAMAVTDVIKECGVTHATIEALEKKGVVSIQPETVLRDPHAADTFLPAAKLVLNAEQVEVFQHVSAAIYEPEKHKPIVLHGVTGSGKTEIYLQAIQLALERGRTAIMLVPEISLTPQTVERFKSRFAASQESVAVLHSHLSEGERHDEWHKINEGRARIVIGARSAIFAPLENLGLIVVDEEHENSYKQEEAPRYHGRDIAVLRASMEKCAVVLGSATPSLESYHNAQAGKYDLLQLRQRVDDRKMPHIRIIDMRLESRTGPGLLSERLCQAVGDRLAKKEQSILFLNRRGFNTSLICQQCGYVCVCPNCSVSLTFHRAASRLICHICGHRQTVPMKCPSCAFAGIRYSGSGTEKVEEAVAKIFPHAVVRRMDADTMTRKEAYRETLHAFRTGKIDVLVGTQMIAKGLHFPNVTLVGIVNADMGLHMPDFRAGERTFQLLTQVAGRAGRGEVEGDVLVQTFTPFHPSIQFARHHDFEGFWQQEIEFREKWDYPPFTHVVLVTVRSPHQVKASFSAETLARRLGESPPAGTLLSKPAPAPLEKVKGSYRFHLMLRTRTILRLSRWLREVVRKLTFPEDVIVTVDVDPYHLL
jgi:primosomal protein N' (replication factor Y) (superfamily II helicase)